MPPHRVAAVLRTLAPNSIPRLSPPRATHPQLSLWPSFSLVAAATTAAARSHTPRTPRFSTKLSRRASGHADLPLPLYHRHHYHRGHHHQRRRSYYRYSTPVAITFGASTFTSSNSTMCCLRRVSAELPSSFQIQPLFLPLPLFPPFIPILRFARAARATLSSAYILRFLLRFSFKFHPTFSPNPTARADDDATATYAVYVSRARLLLPSLLFISFSLLLASCPGDAHFVLTYVARRLFTESRSKL